MVSAVYQAKTHERVVFKLPNGQDIECFVADGVLRVYCDLQLIVYPRGANTVYLSTGYLPDSKQEA